MIAAWIQGEKCSVPGSSRALAPQHLKPAGVLQCKLDPWSLGPDLLPWSLSLNTRTWCVSVTIRSPAPSSGPGTQSVLKEMFVKLMTKLLHSTNCLRHKHVSIFHVYVNIFKYYWIHKFITSFHVYFLSDFLSVRGVVGKQQGRILGPEFLICLGLNP